MKHLVHRGCKLVLVALLAVAMGFITGCGGGGSDSGSFSSSPDSGSTGSSSSPVVTSQPTLTFKFVQGQTALTVPPNTTRVKFSFFASDDGSGIALFEEVRDFAASITVELRDARARSVKVTALDLNGAPLLESTVAIPASRVQDFEVDFADTEPVLVTLNSIGITPGEGTIAVGVTQSLSATLNFSNGLSLPGDAVTWSVTGQATITSDGRLIGTESGEAFVTAEYSGVQREATFTVGDGPSLHSLAVTPNGTVYVPPGGNTVFFTVEGRDQNGNPIEAGAYTLEIVTNNSGAFLDEDFLPEVPYFSGSTESTDTVRITAGGISVLQDIIVGYDPARTVDFLTISGPNPLTLTGTGQTSSHPVTATFLDGHQEALPSANVPSFTYISGNQNVITTTTAGLVTSVSQGETTARARVGTVTSDLTVKVDYGANNAAPTIALDTSVLQVTESATTLTLSAVVTDDQVNFDGGKLTLTQDGSGDVADAVLSLNSPPNIGTVVSTTNSIEVALNSNATPQKVESFLRAVRIKRGANSGTGTVGIELQDRAAGDPNARTGADSRNFEAVLTVGPGRSFATVNDAVDAAKLQNSKNPIISIDAGTYDELIQVFAGNLDSITFYGPNRGVSAGVQPSGETAPVRNPEAAIKTLEGQSLLLIADGLTFQGGVAGISINDFQSYGPASVMARNCRFIGTVPDEVTFGIIAREQHQGLIEVTDCYFYNWSDAIRPLDQSEAPRILRNRFECNFYDLYIWGLRTSIIIQGNSFLGASPEAEPNRYIFVTDYLGVSSNGVIQPGDISGNDFIENGIAQNSSDDLNLIMEGNWWGQAGGPLATQLLTTGAATIDADPAASTPFTNGPTVPIH